MKTKALFASPRTCRQCGKQIQYITSAQQEFCSNACRSQFNQGVRLQRQASMVVSHLSQQHIGKNKKDNVVAFLPSEQVTAFAQDATREQLLALLEKTLLELAQAKAQNTALEEALSKFRRLTGRIFYLAG